MDEFAVDQCRVEPQVAEASGQRRKFTGPVEATARDQPDLPPIEARQQPIPVIFDLM